MAILEYSPADESPSVDRLRADAVWLRQLAKSYQEPRTDEHVVIANLERIAAYLDRGQLTSRPRIPCNACRGIGWTPFAEGESTKCPRCDGTGEAPK